VSGKSPTHQNCTPKACPRGVGTPSRAASASNPAIQRACISDLLLVKVILHRAKSDGVHIVTTDTMALNRLADDAICMGQRTPCRPACTLLERNALGVTIAYETHFKSIVQCRRPQLVFGEYGCAVLHPLGAVVQPPSAAPPLTSSTRARTRP
jgi:hypothetical protein